MTFSTTPVVCLTLAKWETVSGRFGGYLILGILNGRFVATWREEFFELPFKIIAVAQGRGNRSESRAF
jgi:hypothetical protein